MQWTFHPHLVAECGYCCKMDLPSKDGPSWSTQMFPNMDFQHHISSSMLTIHENASSGLVASGQCKAVVKLHPSVLSRSRGTLGKCLLLKTSSVWFEYIWISCKELQKSIVARFSKDSFYNQLLLLKTELETAVHHSSNNVEQITCALISNYLHNLPSSYPAP